MVIRPGWTTHGMNMGQRSLQLNNTYTVNSDGSIAYHVAQMPPNANIFQPGPAFLYVTINGIPSNGTYLIVGTGQVGTQPLGAVASLPPNVRVDSASGSGSTGSGSTGSKSSSISTGILIAIIVGGIAVVGVLGAIFGVCISKRRRQNAQGQGGAPYSQSAPMSVPMTKRQSDSSAFIPLQPNAPMSNNNWDNSNVHLVSPSAPYQDQRQGTRSGEFDSYYEQPARMSTNDGPPRY